MVTDALRRWIAQTSPTRRPGRVGLVLHTSWVCLAQDELQRLAGLPFFWLVPDNVLFELGLLCRSQIFGRKAQLLLDLLERNLRQYPGRRPLWDLEQIYDTCRSRKGPAALFDGTLVFLFGDLNKQEEFLRHVSGFENHFLVVVSGWNCASDTSRVYPIREAARLFFRRPEPLQAGEAAPPIRELSLVRDALTGQALFAGSALHPTNLQGSYGSLYECDLLRGKYIKIYHQKAMTGPQCEKLRWLQALSPQLGRLPVAVPERLLGADLPLGRDGAVIGYVMRRCRGQALRDYWLTGWDGHDPEAIFRQLTLLLLELHSLHIIVNDLSGNNILVDDDDRVSVVDCDSFQLLHYPGGAVTELYRHPEISPLHVRETLREPRHEAFAFAVLLFQCLFYDSPLRQRLSAEDDDEPGWANASFPLDVKTPPDCRANEDILRMWESQPEELRRLFADEFHFRGDHSLGAWIRALDL